MGKKIKKITSQLKTGDLIKFSSGDRLNTGLINNLKGKWCVIRNINDEGLKVLSVVLDDDILHKFKMSKYISESHLKSSKFSFCKEDLNKRYFNFSGVLLNLCPFALRQGRVILIDHDS